MISISAFIILLAIDFLRFQHSLKKDNLFDQVRSSLLPISPVNTETPTPRKTSTPIPSQTPRAERISDPEAIKLATTLVNNHFSAYKDPGISKDERLLDYSIENLTTSFTKTTIVINVYYSVKPADINGYWNQGNGIDTGDGWLRGKFGCTFARKTASGYEKITGMATGCVKYE